MENIPPLSQKEQTLTQAIITLRNLLFRLRKECPWDKEQTMESLIKCSVEELYELIDAIDNKDATQIREELGDLMEHLLFYAMIAEEKGWFTLEEVAHKTTEKLIRRHPHIFNKAPKLETTEVVLHQWEQIKKKEGKKNTLGNLPKTMPSLSKCMRLQEKGARIGFDFNTAEEAWGKIKEEANELQEAVRDNTNKEEEVGDMLFALINYARHIGVDADKALRFSNDKFIRRFNAMEQLMERENIDLKVLSVPERIHIWARAKDMLSK